MELSTSEEAIAMAEFYTANTGVVCGVDVKVRLSVTYKTIKVCLKLYVVFILILNQEFTI